MIFVTVGSQKFQFNRLLEAVDSLKTEEMIFAQIGYSDYKPKHYNYRKFLDRDEFIAVMSEADIVITHGGPSSFIAPLQLKKTPLVVPRKKIYGEHVNDHQVKFCRYVAERIGTIIDVDDIDKLNDIIERYQIITEGMKTIGKSNNEKFCREFEKIVERMFR